MPPPGGEAERDEEVTMVGNGCGILVLLVCEGSMAAPLLLLLRYCVILLWKDPSIGDDTGELNLPRSSAERDQPLRARLRKSPLPEFGEVGEVGELGNGLGMSREPGGRIDRSRTDLGQFSIVRICRMVYSTPATTRDS